jgi:hypothetical protein
VGQRNVLYGWEESKRDVRAIVGNVTRTVHARIADIMDAQVCYCFEMEGKDYAKARDVHRTSTKHKNERKKMKEKTRKIVLTIAREPSSKANVYSHMNSSSPRIVGFVDRPAQDLALSARISAVPHERLARKFLERTCTSLKPNVSVGLKRVFTGLNMRHALLSQWACNWQCEG